MPMTLCSHKWCVETVNTTQRKEKCRNTTAPQHRVAAQMCPSPVFRHTKFLTNSFATCHLWHQTSSSLELSIKSAPKMWLVGSTTVRKIVTTSKDVLEKWNINKVNHNIIFSSVGTNKKNKNQNNTTWPSSVAKSLSIGTHHEFANVKCKDHASSLGNWKNCNNTTQHHSTTPHRVNRSSDVSIIRSSNAHGFCQGSFAEQRVTSDTGTCSSPEPSTCI